MIIDSLVNLFFAGRRDFERRGSIEDPNVPITQADQYLDAAGVATWAGEKIGRKQALKLSAVYKAVNLVSSDVAKLPCHLYRRTEGDGRERAVEHPAYPLLRRKPNETMGPFLLKHALTAHALLLGNGYAYIDRDGAGRPMALLLLDPEATYPQIVDGELWYVTTIGGEQYILQPTDVLHVKFWTWDGITGMSAIEHGRESMGWSLGMRKFSSKFFHNGARTSGVLMTPGHWKKEAAENFRKKFEKKSAGLDNVARTILLEDGAKFVPVTIKPEEAQYIQSMEFSLIDIANWFSLSPHKLGHSQKTSYASVEQENQKHLEEAIEPRLVAWEEEAALKLLTEDEQRADSHYFEYLRDALIRVDFKTKQEGRRIQIETGQLSPDEARAQDNKPPRADGLGGKYWMPSNFTLAGEQPAADPDAGGDAGPAADPDAGGEPDPGGDSDAGDRQAAIRRVILEAAGRLVTRVANEANRAARDPAKFMAWLDDLEKLREPALRILGPPIGLVARDAAAVTAGVVEDFLSSQRDGMLELAGRCTGRELAARVEGRMAAIDTFGAEELCRKIEAATPLS